MADEIDQMQERNEVLEVVRASRKPVIKPLPATGHCYYCESEIGDTQTFCDHECRDAWDAEQKAIARNGGAR